MNIDFITLLFRKLCYSLNTENYTQFGSKSKCLNCRTKDFGRKERKIAVFIIVYNAFAPLIDLQLEWLLNYVKIMWNRWMWTDATDDGRQVQLTMAGRCSWRWQVGAADDGRQVQLTMAGRCSWRWQVGGVDDGRQVQKTIAGTANDCRYSWIWQVQGKRLLNAMKTTAHDDVT